ncbi:thioredoxin family protein [Phenylobacterium hankyongense]|uniref:Thioredoxin family protein n=1 Tax=Phenylobacterium hankyongense TaxID=1813876 RepID=A0A328AZW4_9CAUL|nr:redoxin domain-containing protein [Phenylobacterium hankyongense]RAK59825.1 thioredoxin family protein [Phenylobacterium hankyongense]
MPIRRRTLIAAFAATGVAGVAAPAFAAPTLGQTAPDFRVKGAAGRVRSLAEFRGRTVVLEWTNSECPYCAKHYGSGAMQALQRAATADGVVWLTVASAGPGMEGYFTAPAAQAWKAKQHSAASDILLDVDSRMARAYEAKATPHMFVIDPAGRLAYMGGIDDRPYWDPESLKGAKNYVAAALADLKAGRPVAEPVTRPYGCSVKYAPA